jgi:hypothetical protein
MKIFMPVPADRPVTAEILASIKKQGIEPEIIDCTFDAKKFFKPQRLVLSEKKFKEVALKCTDEFIVYQQCDILHLRDDNISVMQTFLTSHPDFGAVALSRYRINSKLVYDPAEKNTIISGCVMFTRKGLEAVEFEEPDEIRQPTSKIIASSLNKAGLKYGYVDDIMRVQHPSMNFFYRG